MSQEQKKKTIQTVPYYALEELYQALFEQAADGIFIANPQGRYIEVNQHGCEMLGYTRDELLTLSIEDLIPAEELAHTPLCLTSLQTGKTVLSERCLCCQDGRLLPVEISTRMLSDGNLLEVVRDITERKRAEEALRESEERFRDLYENAPNAYFSIGVDGLIHRCNRRAGELLGYAVEELVGRPVMELYADTAHGKEKATQVLQWFRAGETVRDEEMEMQKADGNPIWVSLTVNAVRDVEGRVVASRSMAVDITERKQAEEKYQTHLGFLQSLDQINRAIQGANDLEQIMRDVLDVVLEIFGCDRAWLLHPCDPEAASWQVPVERTRPEYPGALALGVEVPMEPEAAQLMRTVLNSSRPVRFDPESRYPLAAEDAKRFGYQSQISMALHPKTGKPWMFGLHQCSYPRVWTLQEERLFQEIGRRLADALTSLLAYGNLRASEARFRTLVDHATDAFFLLDDQGVVLDVNHQSCESLSYSRQELIGMTISDFDLDAVPTFLKQLQGRLRAGEMVAFDARHRRKDGSVFSVEVRIRPFWEGGRRFSVALARDITKRKQAEEALQEKQNLLLEAQHIAHLGNWWHDMVTGEIYWSDEFFRILGIEPQQPTNELAATLIHSDDLPVLQKAMAESAAGKMEHEHEFRIIQPDGDIRWIHNRWVRVNDEDGKEIKRIGTHQDITNRKRAEESLRRLNRELQAISNCNQVLMRAVDEQTLVNDICRIICNEAGYRMAWVGYAEHDDVKTVRPVAWAGVENGYLTIANISWANAERGRGPTGTAIRCGESVCIQDFATDPQAAPWREHAVQRGYRSSIALPLKDENAKTFGALTIYSTEPNAFIPDEIRLLEELANDLAFGIVVLRARIARTQAEQKISQLAAIVASSDDAIIGKTLDGIIISWNKGAEKIYGYTESEVVGKSISILIPPGHEDEVPQILNRIMSGEHIEHYETARRRKDGQHIQISLTVSPIYNSQGQVVAASAIGRDITEHRRAQEELREAHQLLETIFDHTHMMVAYLDPQFNFIRVNRVYAQADERAPAFFPGKNHFDLYPNTENEAIFRRVVETGQPYFALAKPFEYAEHLERGVSYWDWSLVPVKDPNGAVAGLILALLNVTDRMWAEQALRESEVKFRSIYEQAPIGIELYDPNGRLIDANPTCLAMFGVPDLKSVMGFDLFNDPNIPEDVKVKLLNGRSVKYEASFDFDLVKEMKLYETTKSGKCYLDCLISPLVAEKGEINGYLIHLRDITKRQRAEEELRKLSRAVEQSASIIVITDTQGYIEYVNARFTEITGYTAEEVFGKHTRILKSGHTSLEEYKCLWETITAGKEWRGEFHNKKKNGELYWESASISSIKNAEGVIMHFLAVKEDITERKQAEATQAILEEQLRQAQKMESIGRLAGGVAHDFNNLLTVIQGYCNLIQAKTPVGDPQLEDLEQIEQASVRAASLTRQLLAFSRQQVLTPTVLDLNSLVADLIKMLGRLIGEDITLSTVLRPELWSVTADPGGLEQIIMNLVINARDAMPTGGNITIETNNVYLDDKYAEVHFEAPTGPCVMLAVTDTGHGMDKSTQARIFEPFFTTKEQGQGTGLGLATVYGIVKQSGGHIMVYSEPDQGTTFKIYLPTTETPAPSLSAPQTRPVTRHNTETILLVEDEEAVRQLVRKALQDHGYTLLEAHQGDKALSLARQYAGPIDLLLTDVVMPQMSGHQLADQLRVHHPEMKVIFMSGYTGDAVVEHRLLTGEVEFLSKPFSPSKLASKVREVLDA